MVYLIYAQMPEPLSSNVFENYLLLLPPKFQEKVCQFRRWEDSHNSLMGKILLNEMASRLFKIPNILTQLTYSDYGKPQINASLSFNISHAGNLVVCAMSEDHQVGLDVEQFSEIDFESYLDYMSENEWDQIQKAKNPNWEFLKFWTQKEAVIKADGRGLFIPIKDLRIDQLTAITTIKRWYLQEINLHKDYVCHLATDRVLEADEVVYLDFFNLNK
ncbi:4'-phosphopantetheinyl transferase [Algoriphagus alkaliphilus]|uniref:4'-phosphopantetheinyl transferase n=2 Tax=Algoriphagus alkaliphilus TaxID=279824 RepID=A0A1G5YGJ3_9BACT|nr:4'-phosphopantetheinyl transferase [Algoriphagus alkaliphilus]